MIPQKVKDHLEEYISQEVYVQISVIKGKEKVSTKSAIIKYLNSNHFRDLSEGRPYNHFIDGLRDKCLGKLKNSPMLDKKTDDKIILELQKKLNNLSDKNGKVRIVSNTIISPSTKSVIQDFINKFSPSSFSKSFLI